MIKIYKKIIWDSYKDLFYKWKSEGEKYTIAVNEVLRNEKKDNINKKVKEPIETRKDIALDILQIIREANDTNDIINLKKYFPPASIPFFSMKNNEKNIFGVILMEDRSMILNVKGKERDKNKVYYIDRKRNISTLKNVIYVGKCPNKKYFAFAYQDYIEIREGINGNLIIRLKWPTGLEGIKRKYCIDSENVKHQLKNIIVFPNGKKILLISFSGIFVVSEERIIRLYPDKSLVSYLLRSCKKNDEINIMIDMPHGTVSEDGGFIAIGAQDSNHIILDSKLKIIKILNPETSYPHFSMFSKDNNVILNSCHFYNGYTIEVNINNLDTEDNKIIDEVCRIYAGVQRNRGYIIGDANGYIHFINENRKKQWSHFIGATISSMDICNDKLIVGTFGGTAHLIKLDTGENDSYRIGNSTNIEETRFLIWGSEKDVLEW